MKRNVKGLILAVLVVGLQSLVSANAFASCGDDKISVKGEIVEDAAFPRGATHD